MFVSAFTRTSSNALARMPHTRMLSGAAARTTLKILVIDGYSKAGREQLDSGGATQAGVLYQKMLAKSVPPGVACDAEVVYPADSDFSCTRQDLLGYDGVAWTGSSLTIFSGTPEVDRQIELQRTIFSVGVPSFGSCWAMQVAAVAAGGRCDVNPRGREIGLTRKVLLTPEGRAHPMYEGKPTVFDAFTSHDDEVTHVPSSAIILSGNNYTRIQALSVTHDKGTCWGVQYHPEYDVREVARLCYLRVEKLLKAGYFRTKEECYAWVDLAEELNKDPTRKDLQWQLGYDNDVLSEEIRLVEVRNWLSKQVLPYSIARSS